MDLGVGLSLLIENTPGDGKLAREFFATLPNSRDDWQSSSRTQPIQ
jgi:hypothetical protein